MGSFQRFGTQSRGNGLVHISIVTYTLEPYKKWFPYLIKNSFKKIEGFPIQVGFDIPENNINQVINLLLLNGYSYNGIRY